MDQHSDNFDEDPGSQLEMEVGFGTGENMKELECAWAEFLVHDVLEGYIETERS